MRIVSRIEHASPDCLGRYACETRVIEIVGPDDFPEAVNPDNLLARIEPRDLFAALVVHEWAHLVLDKVMQGRVRDFGRRRVRGIRDVDVDAGRAGPAALARRLGVPERVAISGTVAAMNPLNFAARAWRYFEVNGGCSTVREIVDGEASFRSGRP